MKVFISWSGERSRQVAELFNDWLQCVLQAVNPWLSTKDIDKGSIWFSEITNQLATIQNGIICLTKSNLNSPWILFESGALAKGINSNRIFTFLIDLEPNDVKPPLSQFNHTSPSREDVYRLVATINNGLENPIKHDILNNVFTIYWSEFDKKFKAILASTKETTTVVVEKRTEKDILNEILTSVRGLDKRLRKVEGAEFMPPIERKFEPPFFSKEVTDVKIETLDLSVRLFNALKARKINTVGEITMSDMESLVPHMQIELINVVKKFEDLF